MNLQLSSGYMNACCKQLLLLACLGVFAVCLAQSGRVKDASGAAVSGGNKATEAKPLIDPNDTRTAAALFEDADNYTLNKFDAFEKLKMPYDQQIEQKISREQRDLAASYAKLLTARKLEGPDVYYLGLLYNLARDFEPAYETMRRFL